jgi:hypothetical protein
VARVPRKRTALIVDDDVGLIFWFGEIFAKAGWNIVPALNCRQAVSLAVMWDSHVDLIVVNPALNGIVEMVQALSLVHRPKIVMIRNPNIEPDIRADATINRPDVSTSFSRAEWAEQVRKLLKELIQ